MLCLTRRQEQEFTITTEAGTVITVKVLEAECGACRLGITAPRNISILRDNANKGEPDVTVQIPNNG